MKIRSARLLIVALCTSTLGYTSSAAQTTAAGKHFLWTVRSDANVLYLAGSVHALGADAYPLPAVFEKAFEASDTLVEELDLADAASLSAAPLLLAKGLYGDGRTFESALSKETATMVAQLLQAGRTADGDDPSDEAMDDHADASRRSNSRRPGSTRTWDSTSPYDKATAAKKPVIGLETVRIPDRSLRQHARRGAGADAPEHSDGARRKGQRAEVDDRRLAAGDTATLEKSVRTSFANYPAAYTSLIAERNRNWIPQLQMCLSSPTPCFVVVGAAHMVGPDGLLALLQQKGYRIEQQ